MPKRIIQTTHGTEAVQRNITEQLRYSLKLLGADPATLKLLESTSPLHSEVINEIYAKLESLGADSYLLASVGSWGDTLDAEEVLEKIKDWNSTQGSKLIFDIDAGPAADQAGTGGAEPKSAPGRDRDRRRLCRAGPRRRESARKAVQARWAKEKVKYGFEDQRRDEG